MCVEVVFNKIQLYPLPSLRRVRNHGYGNLNQNTKSKSLNICTVCGSKQTAFDPENGEQVCCLCGNIIAEQNKSQIFSNNSLMGSYSNDSNGQNQGSQTVSSSRIVVDYSTAGINASKIGDRNIDFAGKRLHNSLDLYRLRTADRYSAFNLISRDKNIRDALFKIDTLSEKLNIPDAVKERAGRVYKQAFECKVVKGRSIGKMAAAALYYACKESNLPRNLLAFCDVMDVDRRDCKKKLFSCYNILMKSLNLENPPILDPFCEIERISNLARVTQKTKMKAVRLGEKIKEFLPTVFFGKSPTAIGVCLIYIATKYTKEQVKQTTLTGASDISTVTIRKRCTEYVGLLKKMNDQKRIDEPIPEELLVMLEEEAKIRTGVVSN